MRVDAGFPFFLPRLFQQSSPLNPTSQQQQITSPALFDVFERMRAACAPQPCFTPPSAPGCGWSPMNMAQCFPFNSLSGIDSAYCGTMPTPAPAPSQRVFVIGDLKKFGGGTIRAGFKEMLRPTQGLRDRPGERTHSALPPEDAAKVRALLDSQDPAIKQMLATKVPSGKSFIISENGQILDTVSTKDTVIPNQSLGVGVHAQHMRDAVGRNFDRSAGGQITTAKGSYSVIGTELHSPIKIALDGKDAQLNSGNGFNIAMNGFGGAVSKTSGGLNANEAWLVRDREGNGITRNGVVDGNDVYGDHEGRYKDGYQDLARDFADEVKMDPATGKRYIDLTDPNSRAARELKLLDANGQVRSAAAILKRIDIDGTDVLEADATRKNEIRERANVTYRDGHVAQSADQWFATKPAAR